LSLTVRDRKLLSQWKYIIIRDAFNDKACYVF